MQKKKTPTYSFKKGTRQNNTYFDTESIIGGKHGILTGEDDEYIIEAKEAPECSIACPAGINVKAYVNLIANRRFEEAVEVIREKNPFPAVCGRVCTRPCEQSCEQSENGDCISIRALKRYASDYELARRALVMESCEKKYDEKIAIIGAGPAGLSAAVDLVRMGYPVIVFEEKNDPGGMLRYAIPPYRLPDRVIKREIDWIKGLGVEIKTGKQIDNPLMLLKKGYSAILIACGAPKSFSLGIEGENAEGVIDALLFLNAVNTDSSKKICGKIIIIGGGSTAFDAARSAVRLGAEKVTLAYRRGFEEMPAESEEIEDAKKEDIEIVTLAIPKKILVKKGKVVGMEFFKAKLGKQDDSGRRKPTPIKNSEFVINADIIIPAVGAKPDVESMKDAAITTSQGRINVEEYGQTARKSVFAAGDVETGPSSVVEAIGRGHKAAKGINADLRGVDLSEEKCLKKTIPIVLEKQKGTCRIYLPKRLEKHDRITSFKEVERAFTEFEAVEEASRCFTCGPCSTCVICLPNCEHKQVAAKIKNTEFLLKVPSQLSLEVTEKEISSFTIKSDKKATPIQLSSLTAAVDSDLCVSCGRCEEVCSYEAIRNVFKKNETTVAEVIHDACSSCSACVSACPSGAISQGYMSDNKILARLEKKKTPYMGVKALMSYWTTPSPAFGVYDGVVEVMSERKPSPSFLIRALARSGRGLLLIGPDEQTGSHYLKGENQPYDMVQKTKDLLKLVGVSPERIQYVSVEKDTDPSRFLKEFSQSLDHKKLNKLIIPTSKFDTSPLSESMTILRIIGANPDITPSEEFISRPNAKPGSIVFFEGCLPMLHMIGEVHKLFDLSETRQAIHKLLKEMRIATGVIEGFSCPSKGLLYSKVEGIEEIVSKIAANNLKEFQKINPKKLILGTPESYISFSEEKKFGDISALPDELLKIIKSKKFSHVKKVIALHHACTMKNDPFYETTKKILDYIPGVKIVELKGMCGHTGFEQINRETKESALHLINEAENKGADMIVCTSPYCESHLLMSQRKGAWRSVDIEISNVYRLLLSSLEGDI